MSSRNWPTKLDGNMFGLARLDPEKPPTEIKVATWSNVFSEGGKVAVDIYFDGERATFDLGGITIERSGSTVNERDHLQSLVDDWNEDAAGNWRTLILDAKTKARAHYERTITEATAKLAALDAGVSA